MNKSKLELKVGLFVIVALILLSVFIFKIGSLKNYRSGYSIKFLFSEVSGVKPGSPVRFAGVDVGEVSQINILSEAKHLNTRIEVVAWIQKTLRIPKNSTAYINTLGLLGEKYIEVIPPLEYTAFLKSGDVLVGNEPVMMQHWIDEGKVIIEDLQDILEKLNLGKGTVGKLLNDDKLYTEMESLVSELRQARNGTIGRLLYDDTIYQEMEALIRDLRRHPWKLFWKTKEKND